MNEASLPKRTRALRLAADIAFVLYLTVNFLFAHTPVAQAVMALFCVCTVLLFFDNRRVYFDRFFLFYGLLALWGLLGVLLGFAADRDQAMAMVKTLCVNLAFLFCLFQYLVQRQDLRRCFDLYQLSGLVVCVCVVILSGPSIIHYRFGQLAGVNPNGVAAFLLPACAMGLHLLMQTKRVRYFCSTALFFALVLLTGSRKGLLGAAIVAAVYVLWSDRKHIRRDLLVMLAVAAAAGIALFAVPQLYRVLGERLVNSIKTLLGVASTGELELSMVERSGMIQEGLRLFLARPLTGYGLDCYTVVSGYGTYAHNNFVELLVSGGIPALLLFYAPLAGLLVRGFRNGTDSGAVRLGTALLLTFVLLGVAAVTYYERVDLFVIPLLMAILRLQGQKAEDGTHFWKYVKNPYRVFMLLGDRGLLNFLPDEPYLKLLYRANLGKKADFKHPKTFNEKLNYLKLHDRREIYTTMSDKYAARDFIAEKIGPEYLLPLYGVWNSVEEIDFDALPDSFVIKTTHDSGGVRVVTDKSKLDIPELKRFLKRRLKKKYYLTGRERQYEKVPPRIIAEAYIGDVEGNPPVDYKFFCFDGKMKMINVCTDRNSGVKYWYFDRDKRIIPCTEFCRDASEDAIVWPNETEHMIELAETLAGDLPCLRVDFFATLKGVCCGELTLYDYSGFFGEYIDDWDERLGALITAV